MSEDEMTFWLTKVLKNQDTEPVNLLIRGAPYMELESLCKSIENNFTVEGVHILRRIKESIVRLLINYHQDDDYHIKEGYTYIYLTNLLRTIYLFKMQEAYEYVYKLAKYLHLEDRNNKYSEDVILEMINILVSFNPGFNAYQRVYSLLNEIMINPKFTLKCYRALWKIDYRNGINLLIKLKNIWVNNNRSFNIEKTIENFILNGKYSEEELIEYLSTDMRGYELVVAGISVITRILINNDILILRKVKECDEYIDEYIFVPAKKDIPINYINKCALNYTKIKDVIDIETVQKCEENLRSILQDNDITLSS